MSQESSQEQSQKPAPAPEIHQGQTVFRKLLFALLALTLIIVFTLIVRPSFINGALAGFARIADAKNPPPPAPLVQYAKREIQNPPALAPHQQTPPSVDAQAQSLLAEFEKSSWGASFQDWSGLHSDIPCAPFRAGLLGSADREWAQRCSTGHGREAAHWSFYVFGLQEPLTSRLEQFDVTTGVLSVETLVSLQSNLQTRLTARYGPAEDRSRQYSVPAVRWPEPVRWKAPDLEIELDFSEFDPQRKEGRLSLQGRHRPLLEALKEDDRLKLVATSDYMYEYYRAGSGMDAKLADNLRSDFPDVATMLMKDQPDTDPQTREANQQNVREAVQRQLQSRIKAAQAAGQTGPRAAILAVAVPQINTNWKAEQFHDALVRLLTSVKASPADRRPVLLLAADRLAWRLPSVMANDKSQAEHWGEWRTQLSDFGVSYQESAMSPDENAWTYTGTLLQRVWTDYSDTDWGQLAFLLLLGHGWHTGVDCAGGSDQFRQVIQQGLPFLEKHPNSPYKMDVQLVVAQAYETWWSLSKAPTREEYAKEFGEELGEYYSEADPTKYQRGAETARMKAIASYEQLLQTALQSDHAVYARRELPRLKMGIDTGQRRFYCTVVD